MRTSNPPGIYRRNFRPIGQKHQDMDQLFIKRDKLLAQLNEISGSVDNDEDLSSAHDKRSLSTNYSNETKPTNSQDDEGEEGEISESD
ncbi:unnamed protein product [Rotaria sp. Silwood1]|nr:unnamed protein product [Rotaria sp. Silwood1]CAF1076667.1 unnamed protein product [Rotaria sp. Silwood1]CAF1083562.1 unnamed protein product [Rotaria sp. Silwood1]CAF3413284.1 unnamed protein product [Rotaria sp. Silwood1]CAF3438284.1 unnamed protein product [Rotaria sp. Silwood1]